MSRTTRRNFRIGKAARDGGYTGRCTCGFCRQDKKLKADKKLQRQLLRGSE